MSMPIFAISSRAVRLANGTSNHRMGQMPLVGSEPRKKFRQMDISGASARSWYTVAMPRSSASRVELNFTTSPSTR